MIRLRTSLCGPLLHIWAGRNLIPWSFIPQARYCLLHVVTALVTTRSFYPPPFFLSLSLQRCFLHHSFSTRMLLLRCTSTFLVRSRSLGFGGCLAPGRSFRSHRSRLPSIMRPELLQFAPPGLRQPRPIWGLNSGCGPQSMRRLSTKRWLQLMPVILKLILSAGCLRPIGDAACHAKEPSPHGEATSVKSRQRLRQCRRVHSYLATARKAALSALDGQSNWTVDLQHQWSAIIRAAGYGRHFPAWVLRWPCFEHFPMQHPSLAFCDELLQFLLFDYRALAQSETSVKQRAFRFAVQLDAKAKGDSWAFAQVRPPAFPPFNCVQRGTQVEAVQVACTTFSCREYKLAHAVDIAVLSEVQFAGHTAVVLRGDATSLLLQFRDDHDHVLPLSGVLSQVQLDATSSAVHEELSKFWLPIWSRAIGAARPPILSVGRVFLTCCTPWTRLAPAARWTWNVLLPGFMSPKVSGPKRRPEFPVGATLSYVRWRPPLWVIWPSFSTRMCTLTILSIFCRPVWP